MRAESNATTIFSQSLVAIPCIRKRDVKISSRDELAQPQMNPVVFVAGAGAADAYTAWAEWHHDAKNY